MTYTSFLLMPTPHLGVLCCVVVTPCIFHSVINKKYTTYINA